MTNSLWKNIIRDIKNSKARFISIMLIIALGVGFFTGIKATSPSMNETAEQYYRENNLMDIRLLSTVGFDDEDVAAVRKLDCVRAAMPSYFSDVIVNIDGKGSVIRLHSMPEEDENGIVINKPVVNEGRLPEKKGEIAVEKANFSGDFAIGDTIFIDSKSDEDANAGGMEDLEYTIVGFVQSPLYVSFERGTTTVGSGNIDLYGIITPDNFTSERYTQIYVLTDCSGGSVNTIGDEYSQKIEDIKPLFEQLAEDRIRNFDNCYLPDARKKLSDAQSELDNEREKAEKELSDGELEIREAEDTYNKEIENAQQQLSDGKNQIENAEKELEQGRIEYENGIISGENELNASKEQLKNGKQQLSESKEQFNSAIREGEKQISSAEREYNKGIAEYNSALSDFNMQTLPARLAINALQSKYDLSKNNYENIIKPSIDKAISEAMENINQANERKLDLQTQLETANDVDRIVIEAQLRTQDGIISLNQELIDRENKRLEEKEALVNEDLQKLENAMAEYNSSVAEPQAQLDSAKAQLDDALMQINEGKSELELQKLQGEEQLAAAQEQLSEGEIRISEGQAALNEAKTNGRQKLSDAEDQLEQAKKEYEDAKQEFEEKKSDGKQQLDDAKEEFNKAKSEAENKINDAQSELDKAKEQLDTLENPEWYIFDRGDNPGYTSFIEDTKRVDAVATVFPLFFLLVAALVCLTTMTRHVEEQRTEIGTLKALGYSNGVIKLKFIIYAASASLIGCILGIAIGMCTLPFVIYNAYGIMYELRPLILVMPWGIAGAGSVVGLLCTVFVALYTCQKALSEKPSALMRPKSPKVGKRIFLERIPFVWNRMNFTSKVTARNIMRYKSRFFMTVIGVAGCTALILTGFGLKNSIGVIADKQFGDISKYDMLAVLSEEGTVHQRADTVSFIESSELTESAMPELQTTIEVSDISGENKQNDIYMVVPRSAEDLKTYIDLRERKSGNPIELTDDGVVITEKMSEKLSVSVGDQVVITDNHKEYTVKICGISENYVYDYMYMSPECYENVYGKQVRCNMIVVKMTEPTKENQGALGEFCLNDSNIAAVSFVNVENFQDTIKSLDTIVLVLILCAGLLAVVVLYNLTNINVAERVREIATIKVLGFYNSETCAYVYRENIVLTLVGIAVGLVLGVVLHRFVILTIEIDKIMFSREISFIGFMLSALLTALFAAIVNFVMYFKIKGIDMVESLKSVE